MKPIFTKEFLDSIGFEDKSVPSTYNRKILMDGEPVLEYGVASSKIPKNMNVIEWCNTGFRVNYFGEALEPNISVRIGSDGNTRTLFSGIIYTEQDFREILRLAAIKTNF